MTDTPAGNAEQPNGQKPPLGGVQPEVALEIAAPLKKLEPLAEPPKKPVELGAPPKPKKPEQPRPPPKPEVKATKCVEFEVKLLDGSGRMIHEIYFKRRNYVIYCTVDERTTDESDRQILVQYADDDQGDLSGKQIALVADIIPLRNKLQSLLLTVKNKTAYYVLIAEAFRLGLEQKPEVAKLTLEGAISDLQNIRGSDRRNLYVKKALPYAVISAGVLLVSAALVMAISDPNAFPKVLSPMAHIAIASAAGAIGALLSIAISVRAKTVATEGDDTSVRVDAKLRVLIGVISAGVLYLLLSTGVMSQLKIGDLNFAAGAIAWQLALLIGFASGFLERLVPDMLEKSQKK
jgi:hypothetical protein